MNVSHHRNFGFLLLAVLTLISGPLSGQSLTMVQGTVYQSNGIPATGSIAISWPAFTTASSSVAAGTTTVTLGTGGLLAVSLAPNVGAVPAGSYYVARYTLSDSTVTTELWSVPATGTISLDGVRVQLPSAAVITTVSKSYVDAAISELASNVPVMVWSPWGPCGAQYLQCSESGGLLNLIHASTIHAWTLTSIYNPLGCTTAGALSLYNGTTVLATISFANGIQAYTGTILAGSVPAVSALQIRVSTAAVGCIVKPAGFNSTITYTSP